MENQSFLSQAKEFVAEKLEAAKEAVGLPDLPQAGIEHDKPFLNDIAQGNIETLNHVQPVEKDLNTFLGNDTSNIHIKKIDRDPLLNEIKDGVTLSHVETEDKSQPVLDQNVTIKNIGEQRENLLHEVEGFKRTSLSAANTKDSSAPCIPEHCDYSNVMPAPSLYEQAKGFVTGTIEQVKHAFASPLPETKEYVADTVEDVKQSAMQAKEYVADKLEETKQMAMSVDAKDTLQQTKEFVADKWQDAKEAVGISPEHPQSKTEHDLPFLNDIAKGNVPSMHHVEPVEKDLTAVLGQGGSDIHIKKFDKQPLLNEIKDGVPLAHVETEDKAKPVIEEGLKIKNIGEEREQLLSAVEEFSKQNTLHHVEPKTRQLAGTQ